jgi:hypothetical protein
LVTIIVDRFPDLIARLNGHKDKLDTRKNRRFDAAVAVMAA